MISPAVDKLLQLGNDHRLVALFYRKGEHARDLPRRIVEPYNLTHGDQDIMVRCYQRAPEEGWRFFMLSRIDHAADAGDAFTPRRRVRLDAREINMRPEERAHWPAELQAYRELVSDALADGKVTADERLEIEQYAMNHGIALPQVRFVHAAIFSDCLGAILEDGEVDAEERKQLNFVHRVLHVLGWSVVDG